MSEEEMVPFCTECTEYHNEDDEHYTTDCSDCGCQHMGKSDDCLCKQQECDECECKPDICENCGCEGCVSSGSYMMYCPCEEECCVHCGCGSDEPDFSDGCEACMIHYTNSGDWDPCGYGDTDYINEDCAWASESSPTPSHDNGREFSVVHDLPVTPIHQIHTGNEHTVAHHLGLDRDLDLATAAADFYILERLYEELHDRSWVGTRLNGLRTPAGWGSDTKLEWLAYDVANTRKSLNRELSRQLHTYMVMAVGGELRHSPSNAFKDHHSQRTPKSQWPVLKRRVKWYDFPRMRSQYFSPSQWKSISPETKAALRKMGCAACYWWMTEGNPTDKDYVYPCTRSDTKVPSTHANPDCGYMEAWASAHHIKTGKTTRTNYKPHNGRMDEYFRGVSGESRGLAWRTWLMQYEAEGLPLLDDCIHIFRKWSWVKGYGGPKWAEVAEFTRMYAAGDMSESAFLDRVWTLEHNGGNLFNKYYARADTHRIRKVLNVQANDTNDYQDLRQYASNYTKGLLNKAEALGAFDRAKVYHVYA